MVIPRGLREAAGVSEGTLMQVTLVEGGRLLITPQLAIDRAIVTSPLKNRKQLLKELASTVAELRREAKAKGLDLLTIRQIDATIAKARRAPSKTTRRRAE